MTTDIKLGELSPNSRYSLHDVPLLLPGTCFLCGDSGGDGRKFLDSGKQLKWYGAIYFCSECIREIAEAVGFFPKDLVASLLEQRDSLEENLNEVKSNLVELNESHRAMARSLGNCTCSTLGTDPGDSEADKLDSDSESDDSKSLKLDGLEGFVGIRSTGNDE